MVTATPPKQRDEKEDKKKPGKTPEAVTRVKERLTAAIDADDPNRRNWLTDVKFSVAEDQWDPKIKQQRGSHRPALTFNRLNAIVKQIIGDYRQNKLAIKVLPGDGDASEDTAELIAGLIRNIEAQSNADMAYTHALECACRGGFGYFRVLSQYTGDDVFEQDLVIQPIYNPLTVYMDPAARNITRSDAEWCVISETIAKEQFKRLHPKAKLAGFEDSADNRWLTDDSIRVAEHYEKVYYTARLAAFSNGMVLDIDDDQQIVAMEQLGFRLMKERETTRSKIRWQKVTGAEVLDEREWKGRYIPVIRVAGEEVNIEGKVFTRSAIFYGKDAQREYNYMKSTAVETVALAPRATWLITPEQIQGFEEQWDHANTSPQPYLPYNHDPSQPAPQRIEPPPTPVGEITLAMNASDDIKATTGIYDASMGARSNETSGKAIVARQQQGANATFVFIDNLKEAVQQCGRVVIDMLPVTHDTERVVRVLDLEGNPKTETINRHLHDPLTGITQILNSITVGKYDVLVEAGPSFANRKAEALAGMTQMIGAAPQIMQLAGDLVVKNMDWPGADEIAARLKRSIPPQITEDPESEEGQMHAQQAQAEQQQMMQQQAALQQGQIEAEQARNQATIVKAHAEMVKAHAGAAAAAAPPPTAAPARGPAAPQGSMPAGAAPHPGVTVQFNADDALSRTADHMEAMADAHVTGMGQMMQVVGVLAENSARTNELIAASLTAQQQADERQAQMMLAMGEMNAAALREVAGAVKENTETMRAPRYAVRDAKGNIVAAQIATQPGG